MKYILSYSGGKESTAMLIHMIELKMPLDAIYFCDNGLEYPEVYRYIRRVEKFIGRKISFIKPPKTWDQLFYGKVISGRRMGQCRGFPFVITQCWAQRALKVRPMQHFQSKNDIIYLGINYDERDRMQTEKGQCENLRYPLIDWKWNAQDCLDFLAKKNLFPPLYKKFLRTGCWLCPKQSLNSLRILYRDYPDLWKRLKKYEHDSPHGFKPNFKLSDFEKRIRKEMQYGKQPNSNRK